MSKVSRSITSKFVAAGLAAGLAVASAGLTSLSSTSSVEADELRIPILSYRTGPFAGTGIPLMDGHQDYFAMINERDGGINGVRVFWEECETAYNTEKGMECYEKTKANGGILTQPWSTGITLQAIPRANVDKIPLYSGGYGLSAGAVGDLFPWVFVPPQTYWDGASAALHYMAGGRDLSKLKGQKIALIHLDHPYGKEPIPLLQRMADQHGFTFLPVPVGIKEMQNQSAQWLQIRREKPDWVLMWGWGAMNAGAIQEAVKTRFPMDRFIGVWWSGHDADLLTVGEKGKGYKSMTFNLVGDYPAIRDMKTMVVDAGKSEVTDPATVNRTFYQRGAIMAATIGEAVRTAMDKYGNRPITGSELRWGFENLDITADRWAELGFPGAAQPIKLSCSDHSGQAPVWIVEWDGAKFVKVSDPIDSNRELVRGMLEEAAAAYAESNAPWPGRDGIPCES